MVGIFNPRKNVEILFDDDLINRGVWMIPGEHKERFGDPKTATPPTPEHTIMRFSFDGTVAFFRPDEVWASEQELSLHARLLAFPAVKRVMLLSRHSFLNLFDDMNHFLEWQQRALDALKSLKVDSPPPVDFGPDGK